jgi:small multidrug resistance pump
MKFWIFFIITFSLDIVGMSFAKQYVVSNKWWWLALAIACFGTMIITLVQMLRIESLAFTNAIWAGCTALATVIIGWLVFGEKLSSLQLVGIVLIVGGVILLELPK